MHPVGCLNYCIRDAQSYKHKKIPINSGSAKFRLTDCFESRTGQRLKFENDVDDDYYKEMDTTLNLGSENMKGNIFF